MHTPDHPRVLFAALLVLFSFYFLFVLDRERIAHEAAADASAEVSR